VLRLAKTIKCIIMLNDYKNHVYNPFMPGIITHPIRLHSIALPKGGGGGEVLGGAGWWGGADGRDVG